MRKELKENDYELKRERKLFRKEFLFLLIGIFISLAIQIVIGVPGLRSNLYFDGEWIVVVWILLIFIVILFVEASHFHISRRNEKRILKIENIVPSKVAKSLFKLRFEEKLKEYSANDNKKELLDPKSESDYVREWTQSELSIKKHRNYTELFFRDNSDYLYLYKDKVILDMTPPTSILVNPDKEIRTRLERYKRNLSSCNVVFK